MLSATGCIVQTRNLIRTEYIYVKPPESLYSPLEEPKPDKLETNWDLLMWTEDLLRALRERDTDRRMMRDYITETLNKELEDD
jgi:hypothetical protein